MYIYSPEKSRFRSLITTEEWRIISNILSKSSSCNVIARGFVWETFELIIDSNLISELNYKPIYDAILKFLFGLVNTQNILLSIYSAN